MDTNPALDHCGTTLNVGSAPLTLRLPAGSAIFAVRGEAWITQERLADDIILAAGDRFDVPTRQPIVVSATRSEVQLFVAPPAVARRHADREVYAFARSRAADLRAHEQARVADAALRVVRMLYARARSAFALRPRVPTH